MMNLIKSDKIWKLIIFKNFHIFKYCLSYVLLLYYQTLYFIAKWYKLKIWIYIFLPGNFLVLNDALVIIDLDIGVLQELLFTGVPTDVTLGNCPPK